MKRRATFLALVVCLLGALPSLGATSGLYKVEVVGAPTSGDSAGEALIFALKEQIRASAGFVLNASGSHFIIFIETLDPDKGAQPANLRTAYSVALVFYDASTHRRDYLSSSVGVTGKSRLDETAKGILADLDAELGSGK